MTRATPRGAGFPEARRGNPPAGLAVLVLSVAWLTGCATLVHGPRQSFSIACEPAAAEIRVDGKVHGNTHDTVTFSRRRDHSLDLTDTQGRQTSVQFIKNWDGWIWGNAVFLLPYGLGGLLIDVLTGSSAKLVPETMQEDAGMLVTLRQVPTPMRWEETGLYGGIGLEFMGKQFQSEELRDELDMGFAGWIGKRGWPLELVAKSYFYSSLNAVHSDSWEILSVGAQTAYRKPNLRFYPLAQGGLSYTITSTQGKGAPVGLWANAGFEFRLGRMYLGLLGGYSKGETSTSRINTGGFKFGTIAGVYL